VTRRVIVTRPASQAGKWVGALAQAGFDAVALPLITIQPASDAAAVQAAWLRLAHYDAVMFVSANAVDQFFALKPAGALDFSGLFATKTRALVTGPGSRAALVRAQVDPARVDAPDPAAQQFDSEALWSVAGSAIGPGSRVLVVRGAQAQGSDIAEGGQDEDDAGPAQGVGRDWFAGQVRAAGGQVDFLVAYQRSAPAWDMAAQALALRAAADGSVWLFSSSEALERLQALMPAADWRHARAVVTHARIGAAARALGFGVVCESRPALADLVASIESLQ